MLWAASNVFSAVGFAQANMQAIADAADVTKATLYMYFGDKEQLFRTVCECWLDEMPEPALPCPAQGELRACLGRAAAELLRQSEHPAFVALTYIELRSNRTLQKRWRQRYRPYRTYLEEALSRSVRCADPEHAALQFLLLVAGGLDSHPAQVTESRIGAAVELFVQAYG